MKNKLMIIATSMFAFAAMPAANAALSPECQQEREVQAIKEAVNDNEAVVERSEEKENTYYVHTESGDKEVSITYKPSEKIGPQEFELEFKDAQ